MALLMIPTYTFDSLLLFTISQNFAVSLAHFGFVHFHRSSSLYTCVFPFTTAETILGGRCSFPPRSAPPSLSGLAALAISRDELSFLGCDSVRPVAEARAYDL